MFWLYPLMWFAEFKEICICVCVNSENKCIIYIWNNFGPKRRLIRWLKLPFSCCFHSVAWQGKILLQPFFPPKCSSILNFFPVQKSVSDPRSLLNHIGAWNWTWNILGGFCLLTFSSQWLDWIGFNCNLSVTICLVDCQWSNSDSANPRLTFYFYSLAKTLCLLIVACCIVWCCTVHFTWKQELLFKSAQILMQSF